MNTPISVSSFYRSPSDKKAFIEDGSFVNFNARLFGVVDGNSEAYSPSYPPLIYPGGLTSGQMVAREFCFAGVNAGKEGKAEEAILSANRRILLNHQLMKADPAKEDVGGATFAICQIKDDEIVFIVGGDCFVLWNDVAGSHFVIGFDEAASKVESEDSAAYEECLKKAGGDKGLAWDFYFPAYQAKRIRYANKNVGGGGHASLNGNPALENCWRKFTLRSTLPEWIILGTDGLVPLSGINCTDASQIAKLCEVYSKGGIEALLEFRDSHDNLPHIGNGDWPEATAIEMKF